MTLPGRPRAGRARMAAPAFPFMKWQAQPARKRLRTMRKSPHESACPDRRQMLLGGLAVTAGSLAAIGRPSSSSTLFAAAAEGTGKLKGRVHHSVCRWCYRKIPLDQLCQAAVRIGIGSIELMGPRDWPTLKEHGLTCAMGSGGMGIAKGFNRIEHHAKLVSNYQEVIPAAGQAGIPSVICMSGNRDGMDDETGLKNCALGVKKLMKLCEQHQVTLCMELLNSRVNHPDYMCDHSAWGVELCKQVGSPRFKLLYDIYHMQIMEGDLIRTIRDHGEFFGHYHTGGNPGRHEIDDTQEINYPAVMRAIVDSGYQGYVGQEFLPTGDDPLGSLERCVKLCDV